MAMLGDEQERAFIATTRAAVGAARNRLNSLQAAMDSKVNTLERRVHEQSNLLESEAAERGRLAIELEAAKERVQLAQRRADAAEKSRLQGTPISSEAAALRDEAPVVAQVWRGVRPRSRFDCRQNSDYQ